VMPLVATGRGVAAVAGSAPIAAAMAAPAAIRA